MNHSSVRSTTATTGKTVLALVAVISLLLAFFAAAAARPASVLAAGEHCPGGSDTGAPPGAVNSSSGDESEQNVSITWEGDPGVVTLTNNNTTSATVVFCAKGGTGFDGDSKNSGEITATLAPGETRTFTFGTEISYFVLYSVDVDEEEETPTLTLDKVAVNGDAEFAFTLGGVALADTLSGADPAVMLADEAGSYTIVEALTQAQIDAGWSLTSIACEGNATAEVVDLGTRTVTVTVGADEDVVCTFTNIAEGEQPGGGGTETPREGTQGGSGGPSGGLPNTATAPTPNGSVSTALVALLMLAGLGATAYAVRTEVARRR